MRCYTLDDGVSVVYNAGMKTVTFLSPDRGVTMTCSSSGWIANLRIFRSHYGKKIEEED